MGGGFLLGSELGRGLPPIYFVFKDLMKKTLRVVEVVVGVVVSLVVLMWSVMVWGGEG